MHKLTDSILLTDGYTGKVEQDGFKKINTKNAAHMNYFLTERMGRESAIYL
jgi:hypothetical protein